MPNGENNGNGEDYGIEQAVEDFGQYGPDIIAAAQGNYRGGGGGGGRRRRRVSPSGEAGGTATGGAQQTAQAQTAQGGTQSCTPESVAVEMELGFRDENGRPTPEGRREGVPECDTSVRRQGVAMYQQRQGGGGQTPSPTPAQGGGGQAPQPPQGPSQAPQAPSTGPGGYTMTDQEVAREVPANLDMSVPASWMRYAGALGKYVVSMLGPDGANEFLSALASMFGRRINPNTKPKLCFEKLKDNLQPSIQEAVELWQCGAEQPYTDDPLTREVFFAIELATSGYDMQTGRHNGCCSC